MLGPNKWRLLTIVAGILLAHAIDSPNGSPRIQQTNQSTKLGLSIQKIVPWDQSRTARNLYQPYKRFSNIDNVQFVERRTTSDRDWKTSFGAFRYAPNSDDDFTRRSDDQLPQLTFYEVINNMTYQFPSEFGVTTNKPTESQILRKPQYKYIPLHVYQEKDQSTAANNENYAARTRNEQEIQSRTDTNLYRSEALVQLHPHLQQQQQQTFQQHQIIAAQTDANKVIFPETTSVSNEDIQGRRSGMEFTAQTPNFGSLFVPQSYQEDNPNHPNFQSPYSEELEPIEPRTTRGINTNYENHPRQPITFPGTSSVKTFRDDVTKFGDVNGPVAVQRQFSDYLDQHGLRSIESIIYDNDYRFPRQHFPPKSYVEYGDYPGPPRSRLINSWKTARQPRVVFPANDNFPSGLGVSSYTNNDNIVFR